MYYNLVGASDHHLAVPQTEPPSSNLTFLLLPAPRPTPAMEASFVRRGLDGDLGLHITDPRNIPTHRAGSCSFFPDYDSSQRSDVEISLARSREPENKPVYLDEIALNSVWGIPISPDSRMAWRVVPHGVFVSPWPYSATLFTRPLRSQ